MKNKAFRNNTMETIINILNDDYGKKQKKNHLYSQRAYARDLGIEPGNLSKILSGKLKPGTKLLKKLLDGTELSSKEKEKNLKILNTSYIRLNPIKEGELRKLDNQTIKYLSSKKNFEILELLDTKWKYKTDKELAKKLKITEGELLSALENMRSLGIVEKKDTHWVEVGTGKISTINSIYSSKARKQHQKEILEGAINALENISDDIRDQSSITIAIDPDYIPAVKELVRDFRRSLSKYLNEAAEKKEVYQMSFSLYPASDTAVELDC